MQSITIFAFHECNDSKKNLFDTLQQITGQPVHTLWNLLIGIEILVHIHRKIDHICVAEKIQLSL